MKTVIGILLILGSIALGLYVGVWLCLIGGIIQIVNALFHSNPADGLGLMFGIVRILISGLAGWTSFAMLLLPGVKMLENK